MTTDSQEGVIELLIERLGRLRDALVMARPGDTAPAPVTLDERTLVAIRDGLKRIERGTR